MEHKVIGEAGLLLCYTIAALVGWGIGARSLGAIPSPRFMLLPLAWAALFVPLAVGQYYLDGYLSSHAVSVGQMLLGDLPVGVLFASTWLGSYWARRKSALR